MKSILIVTALLCTFYSSNTYAQLIFAGYENLFTQPRQYTVYLTTGSIKIDGELKEASWDNVPWSDNFTDIEGDNKPTPTFKTRFKLLWDSEFVYIAAELEEPHIWATLKQHDAIIFEDNDFEIFIDPDGDTHNYFEIEANAYNTIFDLFLSKPYRNGGAILINWDVQKLKSAVSIKGKINKPKGLDKKWFIEMAIPFRSLSIGNKLQVPKDQSIWRINFSRVEWDTQIINGAYVKKVDSITQRTLPEHNWVWSPQGVVNMHLPERWGYLHFSTQKATRINQKVPLPASEEFKKYLWLVFYKQQTYRHLHNVYAADLTQLNIPSLFEVAGLHCSINLQSTSTQYTAELNALPDNAKWQINQEGKIIKL